MTIKRLPLDNFFEAVHSTARISGLTHNFYRYPARFSPLVAREAIKVFTNPGDIVLDPFIGGGTTLVEASYLGRKGVGVDINQLATFISLVKTTPLNKSEISYIKGWLINVDQTKLQTGQISPQIITDESYKKNLNDANTWRIRNVIDLLLRKVNKINSKHISNFLRCALLNTGQWALDGRKNIPSTKEFKSKYKLNIQLMLEGIYIYSETIAKHNQEKLLWQDGTPAKILNMSATKLNEIDFLVDKAPALVLMSPPYPGIHVLYHRWQIRGRKETPAPFWIANKVDGSGASYYTISDRKSTTQNKYFDEMQRFFEALSTIVNKDTTIVQLLAFSNPKGHLKRYLEIMELSGFREVFFTTKQTHKRLWRSVPNRKWYAGQEILSSGSREVVLIHKLK